MYLSHSSLISFSTACYIFGESSTDTNTQHTTLHCHFFRVSVYHGPVTTDVTTKNFMNNLFLTRNYFFNAYSHTTITPTLQNSKYKGYM